MESNERPAEVKPLPREPEPPLHVFVFADAPVMVGAFRDVAGAEPAESPKAA